ncbi:MAG: PocR ligand-binding domain-containing protein [Chitinispirillales bacterium]|jgi:signal transduction histidine kinase|nr:PocR ligand-binding domain-containing protein [Chitinispirillales bacterium]
MGSSYRSMPISFYGDISESNKDGEILSSVGREILTDIARDAIELLDMSVSIFEKDGSYALLAVSSSWCRFLDHHSREACGAVSNIEAMNSGKWLCHEFRRKAALKCISAGCPNESVCSGGLPYFSIPVRAGLEIIGAMVIGIGNISTDPRQIMKIAECYGVDYSKLLNLSKNSTSHPASFFDINKNRLFLSSRMIGSIVERKRAERAFRQAFSEVERRVELRTAELERSKEMLRANEEMNLLGQFVSGVAHEVRNPLNGILAITEALNAELNDNPEYGVYINHIRDQVGRLSDLMRDLLNFGKPIEKSNLQPVSISNVVSDALQTWKNSSKYRERKVIFNNMIDNARGVVNADINRLQQVFINLLENACNHSSDSSKVTISLESGPVMRVTDEGSGVKDEHLDKLFKPFFTTRKGGTGLGLGIVKQIIQNHGGTVRLYNNSPHPGCTAEICLPEYRNWDCGLEIESDMPSKN